MNKHSKQEPTTIGHMFMGKTCMQSEKQHFCFFWGGVTFEINKTKAHLKTCLTHKRSNYEVRCEKTPKNKISSFFLHEYGKNVKFKVKFFLFSIILFLHF